MNKGYSTVPDHPLFDEKKHESNQNWYHNPLHQKWRTIFLNRIRSRSLGLKLLSTTIFFGLVFYFIQHFTFHFTELVLSDETAINLMKAIPSSDHIKSYFETYATHSHLAGSDADYKLAEWTHDQFIKLGQGYIDTTIDTFYPTLNYPLKRRLAILVNETSDVLFEATLQEDKDDVVPTFHAYSGNGNVTGPVVYVNYGRKNDFQFLSIRGMSFKGTIALIRYGKISRGLKVKMAQDYGCIGAILYTDPDDEGPDESEGGNGSNNASYPEGPRRSSDSVERGSVEFLSYMPGDPTTPGYAATLTSQRVPLEEAINIPKIPSLPISWKEALPLLKATQGFGFESDVRWKGGLCDVDYYTGPSQAQVNLINLNEYQIKPIWNVIGKILGSEEPEKAIIIGNHRDAWGYGAVDPSSGSAVLLELVRALGVLSSQGWRPRRTIIIGSWDGEEYGAVGSTEWVEAHHLQLSKEAVAYINVDYAVSGTHFTAQASPLLNQLIYEVTREVVDPHSSLPVFEVWKNDRIPLSDKQQQEDVLLHAHPLVDPLGSDSDYTAFFNHLGIASASIGFRGDDYGVHHSLYDSIDWMNQYGDPTYEYHQALTKIWGMMLIRLASDYFLPLSPYDYAIDIARSLTHIANQQGCLTFPSISPALDDLTSTSHHFNKKVRKWKHKLESRKKNHHHLSSGSSSSKNMWTLKKKKLKHHMRTHNKRVLYFERAFVSDPQGLPHRPWFKHVIYGPELDSGLPQAFPSLVEILEMNNDTEAIQSVEERIGHVLLTAKRVLKGRFGDLDMHIQDDDDEEFEDDDDEDEDDFENHVYDD